VEVSNKKLLIVDNEATIRQVLATRFTILGYRVFLASNGKSALNLFKVEQPDLIILELILPKLDGFEVCRKIRETSQVPIIILSGLGGVSDRVLGLNLGADDYVTKPFSPKELEARIRAVFRRFKPISQNSAHPQQDRFSVGPLIIDLKKRIVLKNSTKIQLTGIEFHLLELLLTNPGKSFSRTTILDNVWGYTPERYVDTRVVDVHISRLRGKLEDDPRNPNFFLTVRGLGYKFQP